MVDFQVRSMRKEDLPAVGVLAGQLVRMHHAWDRLRFFITAEPEKGYQRWFATQLELEDTILLVAEDAEPGSDGERIVGYAYARMEERSYNDLLDACAMLHDILVADRARGRGIGEAIVKEVFARAKAKGAPRVVLVTATQNEAGQRLFQRCGFRRTMVEMTAELE